MAAGCERFAILPMMGGKRKRLQAVNWLWRSQRSAGSQIRVGVDSEGVLIVSKRIGFGLIETILYEGTEAARGLAAAMLALREIGLRATPPDLSLTTLREALEQAEAATPGAPKPSLG